MIFSFAIIALRTSTATCRSSPFEIIARLTPYFEFEFRPPTKIKDTLAVSLILCFPNPAFFAFLLGFNSSKGQH
jgi:hypothetical protein